jgi:hypothetical protein
MVRRHVGPLITAARYLLFALYLGVASVILLFAALEIPRVNERMALDLPYYAMRRAYRPDPALVFTSRFEGRPHRAAFSFPGDLYSPTLGVSADPIVVDVSYDDTGYRSNRSLPPYEVVVIGDSYVELSESDGNSFTELLSDLSGRSTLNRGTSWYGPYQYVEVLNRLRVSPQPRYALFMFYAGNDITDITEYERWRREGRYYGQDDRYWKASFPQRFLIASDQARDRIRPLLLNRLRGSSRRPAADPVEGGVHPSLAVVRLGDRTRVMSLAVGSPEATPETLLATAAWRTLRRLVDEFRASSVERGMTPVLVYLPTKNQTYAQHIDVTSGTRVLNGLEAERQFAGSEASALASIAADAGVAFVDILPLVQSLAAQGEMLYHPFDTHWNETGRRAAAQRVADALAELAVPPRGES